MKFPPSTIRRGAEFRLRRYLIKNAKELYGLPGLSVPEIFRLKKLKIEYVPCHPMAGRFIDNFIRVGDLYVGHWDTVAKEGGYTAKRLVDEKGVSLLQGHTHRFGAHARTTVDGRIIKIPTILNILTPSRTAITVGL